MHRFRSRVAATSFNPEPTATVGAPFARRRWLRVKLLVALASFAVCAAVVIVASGVALAADGQLELRVVDKETGQPLPCRIHLQNAAGHPVHVPHTVALGDHFICDGRVVLKLNVGNYSFLVERGSEYLEMRGQFRLDNFADDVKTIELRRFCNMAKEGWWSGDFDVQRSDKDLQLLMQAEDLHVVPLTTFWRGKSLWTEHSLPAKPLVVFDTDRCLQLFAGEDALAGGTLGYLNLTRPIGLVSPSPSPGEGRGEGKNIAKPNTAPLPPSFLDHVAEVRQQHGAWIDARSPCAWDFPLWVGLGRVDSVEVLDRQFGRDAMLPDPPSSKPRDAGQYPAPMGIGRWPQAVYFQLLNCGLRIPPTAGSGSGPTTNPLGYNRLYVYCGEQFSYERWWDNLKAGQVVLSNGPLIRPLVEGHPPGHVFTAPAGQQLDLEIALNLSTREKILYLEIVQNGRAIHEVRLDDFAQKGGKLPHVIFDASGWFLVRAVVDSPKVYRMAMTGPYYVQIGEQPRISRSAVQMFLEWLDQRQAQLKIDDATQRDAMLAEFKKAREFWTALLAKTNAP